MPENNLKVQRLDSDRYLVQDQIVVHSLNFETTEVKYEIEYDENYTTLVEARTLANEFIALCLKILKDKTS